MIRLRVRHLLKIEEITRHECPKVHIEKQKEKRSKIFGKYGSSLSENMNEFFLFDLIT